MLPKLNKIEARVLGALLEKDMTTPEYYPLTLNALVNACNQKSNRDPVMNLAERQVQDGLQTLERENLAMRRQEIGDRSVKYAHKLSGTLSQRFEFKRQELAVLCVLLLRGPQTPGEIRGRTGRMHEFSTVDEVETVLRQLAEKQPDPYVCELARQPGRRESRYTELFSAVVDELQVAVAGPRLAADAPASDSGLEQRVATLEIQVAELLAQINELRDHVHPGGAVSREDSPE